MTSEHAQPPRAELEPCPFCGGSQLAYTTDWGDVRVACGTCGGKGGANYNNDGARERWNRRPPPPREGFAPNASVTYGGKPCDVTKSTPGMIVAALPREGGYERVTDEDAMGHLKYGIGTKIEQQHAYADLRSCEHALAEARRERDEARAIADDVVGDANMLYNAATEAAEGESLGEAEVRMRREAVDHLREQLTAAKHSEDELRCTITKMHREEIVPLRTANARLAERVGELEKALGDLLRRHHADCQQYDTREEEAARAALAARKS